MKGGVEVLTRLSSEVEVRHRIGILAGRTKVARGRDPPATIIVQYFHSCTFNRIIFDLHLTLHIGIHFLVGSDMVFLIDYISRQPSGQSSLLVNRTL